MVQKQLIQISSAFPFSAWHKFGTMAHLVPPGIGPGSRTVTVQSKSSLGAGCTNFDSARRRSLRVQHKPVNFCYRFGSSTGKELFSFLVTDLAPLGRFRKHNATPNRDVTCFGMAWARLPVSREVASA